MQPSRPLHLIKAGQFRVVDWRAGRAEMTFGEMQVNGSGLEVGMPEQRLHGGQIRSSFHQMGSEAVSTMPHAA